MLETFEHTSGIIQRVFIRSLVARIGSVRFRIEPFFGIGIAGRPFKTFFTSKVEKNDTK